MRALIIAAIATVSACSNNPPNPAAIRQERLASPTWKRLSTHMGARVGALTKVDRFTTSAERGNAILARIEDPVARAKALADWDREIERAVPTVAKAEDRAIVREMLVARNVLSQAPRSLKEGASR